MRLVDRKTKAKKDRNIDYLNKDYLGASVTAILAQIK